MEDAPYPLETRKLINAFELDINYNEKPIKIKFNNSDEDRKKIILTYFLCNNYII